MAERRELDNMELESVNGGQYITVDMTIEQIISEDRNCMSILSNAGIPASGNKKIRGMSLYEAAEMRGVDAYALENRINEYLAGK